MNEMIIIYYILSDYGRNIFSEHCVFFAHGRLWEYWGGKTFRQDLFIHLRKFSYWYRFIHTGECRPSIRLVQTKTEFKTLYSLQFYKSNTSHIIWNLVAIAAFEKLHFSAKFTIPIKSAMMMNRCFTDSECVCAAICRDKMTNGIAQKPMGTGPKKRGEGGGVFSCNVRPEKCKWSAE